MTDVVTVNPEGLFDPHKYTTAGQPHLMEYLWGQYRFSLAAKLSARAEAGQPVTTLDEAVARAPASHFFAFCVAHLLANRPVNSFFADTNLGVVLASNTRVVVSPGFDLRGSMQDAKAVGVTDGLSQPGNDGVTRAGTPIGII